jgi:NADH:ubiquinone oxidoreductase subunit D
MKIPADAIISEEKFTRYLLVKREFDDKSRFLAIAGFTFNNYLLLIDEIRRLISENNAVKIRTDEYGTFFKTTGFIYGQTGVKINVSTIWIQRKVDGLFQFVTLIPVRRG